MSKPSLRIRFIRDVLPAAPSPRIRTLTSLNVETSYITYFLSRHDNFSLSDISSQQFQHYSSLVEVYRQLYLTDNPADSITSLSQLSDLGRTIVSQISSSDISSSDQFFLNPRQGER